MPFEDDKAPICVPFILQHLSSHTGPQPLIIGLNGIQGVGKTTLVELLTSELQSQGARTIVCSIDDFYLKHSDQAALAAQDPTNALFQQRGEPGTHDVALLKSVLSALVERKNTRIPKYDKAAFSGQGDRMPEAEWTAVDAPVDVVVLEGWSVGFRPISDAQLVAKRDGPSRTLQKHSVEHLRLVNEKLKAYDSITDLFDVFIHIDAEDTQYVYDWRWEQEEYMRAQRGDPTIGMNKEQVVRFVDGYYPAYELFTDGVRAGVIAAQKGKQLSLIVGKDRKVRTKTVV